MKLTYRICALIMSAGLIIMVTIRLTRDIWPDYELIFGGLLMLTGILLNFAVKDEKTISHEDHGVEK